MILGLEQGIYKMSLENLIVTEDNELLNKNKEHNKGMSKDTEGKPTERASNSQSWNKLSIKIKNKVE